MLHVHFNRTQIQGLYRLWIYEHEPAEDATSAELYHRCLAESKLVILLLGNELRSAVCDEIRTAIDQGKPILKFFKGETAAAEYARHFGDPGHYNVWSNANELIAKVTDSLNQYAVGAIDLRISPSQAPTSFATSLEIDTPPAFRMAARRISDLCDLGRYSIAKSEIETILLGASRDEEKIEARALMAYLLRRETNFDGAIRCYQKLFAETGLVRFRFQEAITFVLSYRLGEAESILHEIYDQKSVLGSISLLECQIHMYRHEWAEALESLQAIRSRSFRERHNIDCWLLLAICLSNSDHFARAERAFSKVPVHATNSAAFVNVFRAQNLSQLYSITGQRAQLELARSLVDKATEEFQDSMLANPSEAPEFRKFMVLTSGIIHHLAGESTLALTTLEELAVSFPTDEILAFNIEVIRNHLYGSAMPMEVLMSARHIIRGEGLWEGIASQMLASTLNGITSVPEFLDVVTEYAERHPDSTQLKCFQEFATSLEKPLSVRLKVLEGIYTSSLYPTTSKQNAMNIAYAAAGAARSWDDADLVEAMASKLGLWNLQLTDYVLTRRLGDLGLKPAKDVFSTAKPVIDRIVELIIDEYTGGFSSDATLYRSLGKQLFRLCRASQNEFQFTLIVEGVSMTLTGARKAAFLEGMALSLT